MNEYLQEAARLLRKAAEENEKAHRPDSRFPSFQRSLIEGRERIAMKFAELGAIEAGVIPQEMLGELLQRLIPARDEAS